MVSYHGHVRTFGTCCLFFSCQIGVQWMKATRFRLESRTDFFDSHRIHGTGIFTYICWIYMVHVGKYTSPMDAVGLNCLKKVVVVSNLFPIRIQWPPFTKLSDQLAIPTKSLSTLRLSRYCWWFRNPVNSPVEVGSFIPLFTSFLYIPGVCLGFLPSTPSTMFRRL